MMFEVSVRSASSGHMLGKFWYGKVAAHARSWLPRPLQTPLDTATIWFPLHQALLLSGHELQCVGKHGPPVSIPVSPWYYNNSNIESVPYNLASERPLHSAPLHIALGTWRTWLRYLGIAAVP